MTYLQLIALINQWIITNGNREITADVLNPILRAITDWALSQIGILSSLNTDDKSNLVAAINEVNTNLANININGSQVYSGMPNPNITPPAEYKAGDFYRQIDVSNNTIALFLYDGTVWQNLSQIFNVSSGFNKILQWDGTSTITVPNGYSGTGWNMTRNKYFDYSVSGTDLTIDPATAELDDMLQLTSN